MEQEPKLPPTAGVFCFMQAVRWAQSLEWRCDTRVAVLVDLVPAIIHSLPVFHELKFLCLFSYVKPIQVTRD